MNLDLGGFFTIKVAKSKKLIAKTYQKIVIIYVADNFFLTFCADGTEIEMPFELLFTICYILSGKQKLHYFNW